MEHQRPPLDRAHGDLEQGFADVLVEKKPRHAAPHAPPPSWLISWETKRPIWLMECIAEAIGVFFYCFAGIGASASFFVTAAEGVSGYGSLLTVGLAYGMGVAMALLVVVPVSGGHLSPSYTTAFAAFKGFPIKKVWRYILAQLIGAFLGTLAVYGQYKEPIDLITAELKAAGKEASIFTPTGPAGVFALFPGVSQADDLRWVFLNEFMCNVILAILIFAVIDGSNFLVEPAMSPWIIGAGYSVVVWAFASQSIALNAARDFGARMACAAIFDGRCFSASPGYTALAALTTFPATLVGAMIHTLFIADTDRLIINLPPGVEKDNLGLTDGEPLTLRTLTRTSVAPKSPISDTGSDGEKNTSLYHRENVTKNQGA